MNIDEYRALVTGSNYGEYSPNPDEPDQSDPPVYHKNTGNYKFAGVLDSILTPVCEQGVVVDGLGTAFDIQNASGAQLDVIGELVGISRMLPYAPETPLIVDGESVYTREMTDDEYRIMIRLKISRNEWDGTNEGAAKMYRDVFNDDVRINFVDNQDMTVTLNISGDFSTRQIEILNFVDSILIPSGIGKTVNAIGGKTEMSNYFGAAITGIEWIDSVDCEGGE